LQDAVSLEYDGLRLKMSTTAPSFVVYSGKYNPIYKGDRHGPFSGIAFEPARYVDAINHPEWKDCVILKPGDKYYQETDYSV
jgi:galactose mutarotase-like enzyme